MDIPRVVLQHTTRARQLSSMNVSINSSSSLATISSPPAAAQRRLAHYHPTIWGPKLIDSFTTHYTYELHGTQLERLKQNVARTLLAASNSTNDDTTSTSISKLIDSMQRLGMAYHFEKEIKVALLGLVSSSATACTTSDLVTVALQFRILRQHRISIGTDAFNKFKSKNGRFKESLSKELQRGMPLQQWRLRSSFPTQSRGAEPGESAPDPGFFRRAEGRRRTSALTWIRHCCPLYHPTFFQYTLDILSKS